MKMQSQSPFQLCKVQIEQFHRDGYLILPGFYDLETEIIPILQGIHEIIGILIKKYGLPIAHPAFSPEAFDSGYQALIAYDRKIGGDVYDAVKHLPSFLRLLSSTKNEQLVQSLRNSSLVGTPAGNYGIRIDNPSEDRFKTFWHQDYPSHFRSIDGLVLWAPLVPITSDLGPVELLVGSHVEGLARLELRNKNLGQPTSYQEAANNYKICQEESYLEKYPRISPLSSPGDLVIFDFLLVHQSGANISSRSRWSMQFRYFNYHNPLGQKISWAGSLAAGKRIEDTHPEIVHKENFP